MSQILIKLNEIIELLKLNKPVLTLQEFCLFAGISEHHGYKLTSEFKIKFYRPGGKKIYIDREDAIAYLKQNPINSAKDIDGTNYFLTSKIAA